MIMKKNNPNVNAKGDFILRWKLGLPKKRKRSKDPLRDFFSDILKELLDIVALTYKGEDVKVDGFHFLDRIDAYHLYK